jgi:hypothetical protein
MSTSPLLSPGFSAEQETYIGWLATPSPLRSPENETLLAEHLDIDPFTLRGWRKLPGFMAAVRRATGYALAERYADLVANIEELALGGSIQHQRLYLQLLHEDPTESAATGPNIKVLAGVDLALVGNATIAVPREVSRE